MGKRLQHGRVNARIKLSERVSYSSKGPDGKVHYTGPVPTGPRRAAALKAKRRSSML